MTNTSNVNPILLAIAGITLVLCSNAELPPGYKGKPFQDTVYTAGPQSIPGRVECAYYDLGGEGVDISYTKDFADFNHTNFVAPVTNQLYIGWTADGEWCNYTVNVKKAGDYRVIALYGNAANTIRFSINHKPAAECKLPLATGSMHKWNKAEIGTITFPEDGLQLLTFHYNSGNNFAYFEFEPVAKP